MLSYTPLITLSGWEHKERQSTIDSCSGRELGFPIMEKFLTWFCPRWLTRSLSQCCSYGAWFALRAVVVFDDLAYVRPQPEITMTFLTAETQSHVKACMAIANNTSQPEDGDPQKPGSTELCEWCRQPSLDLWCSQLLPNPNVWIRKETKYYYVGTFLW